MSRLGDPSRKTLYQGVWAAGTYRVNDVVLHEGNLYVATTGGTNEPPHADWTKLGAPAVHGASASYLKTADGAQTALVAANAAGGGARIVMGHVYVDEVFADGDGTQPTFIIGETDTTNKFLAVTELAGAAAGTRIPFAGTLTEAKALFVTANDGSGTTFTGGITVVVTVFPLIT